MLALGNDAVEMTNCSTTVREKALDVVCPALVTWAVNVLVPVAVGVPEITP
jgi:hypothetical protein